MWVREFLLNIKIRSKIFCICKNYENLLVQEVRKESEKCENLVERRRREDLKDLEIKQIIKRI